MVLVLGPRVPLAQRPVHAELQRVLETGHCRRDDSLGPDADGDVIEKRLRQLLAQRPYLGLGEICPHQTHAAVDVEADAARRDDRQRVVHVEGGDVADGKTVPGMHVRHRDRARDYPR